MSPSIVMSKSGLRYVCCCGQYEGEIRLPTLSKEREGWARWVAGIERKGGSGVGSRATIEQERRLLRRRRRLWPPNRLKGPFLDADTLARVLVRTSVLFGVLLI